MDILPLFHDTSDKRGLLTYNKPPDFSKAKDDKELIELKARYEAGPQSIIKICKDYGITQCFGVSRFMNSYRDAFNNLKKEHIQYNFGLELIMCNDAKEHNEQSLINNHKVIVFSNNQPGYLDLIRISTACHNNIDNFYYEARFDYKQLKELWTNNLTLVIPFFDSFIHKNLLTFASIIPDLSFTNPVIYREIDSGLPFESLINKALDEFNKSGLMDEQNVKTIYYYKPEDSLAYQTYRCISNRSTLQKPELEFFCSSKFNFMDYLELKGK